MKTLTLPVSEQDRHGCSEVLPQEGAPNGLSKALWLGTVEDGVQKCMVLLEVPGKCSIISTRDLLKTQGTVLIYISRYRPGLQMCER